MRLVLDYVNDLAGRVSSGSKLKHICIKRKLSDRYQAMPAMSRCFRIPMTEHNNFSLTLHEPSITSDNLGMKTWVSSYLLSKRLHALLLPQSALLPSTYKDNRPLKALELGAGTGLVGLSFAALWGSAAAVHLTDLEDILPNLSHNVSLNQELLNSTGASVSTDVLDWSAEFDPSPEDLYDVILAADSLYSPQHPKWLVQTISRYICPDSRSRVVVEFPLRDAYSPQLTEFKQRMVSHGLLMLQDGEEVGYDDWEGHNGEPVQVRCWWSVWTLNGHYEKRDT